MGGQSGGGGHGGRAGGGGGSEAIYDAASQAEKDAVRRYTVGSDSLTRALFGTQEMTPEIKDRIANLDKLVDKSTVTKTESMYRGLKERHFDKMVADLKPGDKFSYTGFMSASKNQEVARSFAEYKGNHDLLVKVTVKPGAKAFKIPAKAGKYMDSREAGKETLIGRNQKFIYKGMTTTKDAKILNIEYAG